MTEAWRDGRFWALVALVVTVLAVTFFLFGLSRAALSLVPALAALGLVLLVYRTGALLFGHGAGLLGMLFATIVSPYVAAHYERARAYYVEHLLLGQVVLCAATYGETMVANSMPSRPAPCPKSRAPVR